MTVTTLLTVFTKNIDFLKKDQLDSHKNASNQTNVPRCNENKFLFYQYISKLFRNSLSFAMTVTTLLTELTKNIVFLKRT